MEILRPPRQRETSHRERIAEVASRNLPGSPQEQTLLDRGLLPETIAAHRLGLISSDIADQQWYVDRISIPYINAMGQVSQIRYRAHGPDDKKYLGEPGVPASPYNIGNMVNPSPTTGWDELHIAEGEFDCMILSQVGLHSIGVPGATQWSDAFTVLAEPFDALYVWADPDSAGDKLVETIKKSCTSQPVIRVPLPEDVNDAYLSLGGDALLELAATIRGGDDDPV